MVTRVAETWWVIIISYVIEHFYKCAFVGSLYKHIMFFNAQTLNALNYTSDTMLKLRQGAMSGPNT